MYKVNETERFAQVCVDLSGEIQRSVTAEVSTLSSTATGKATHGEYSGVGIGGAGGGYCPPPQYYRWRGTAPPIIII